MADLDPASPFLSVTMARRLAHALRTPVGVVDGVLSEIGGSPGVLADPTLTSFAALGRRSMHQLLELAERLDWVARVARVPQEPTMPLSWPELLQRCFEKRTEGRRERDKKRVSLVVGDAVGEGGGHRDACERVLIELVDNAVRHARTVMEVIAEVEGDQLRVRVADDGPGLPESGEGVFLPPQAPGPRLGIGLWLVDGLARAMRGTVNVDRTGPGGTVMCLRLPILPPEVGVSEPRTNGSI